MIDRVVLLVLDSVGIGELPDAWEYGDEGSNTLGHIYEHIPGFSLPTLERLGLGNITGITSIPAHKNPIGCYGKAAELSKGKDTTSGHWEIAGIIVETPFPTYPQGFPAAIINEFERLIGRKTLGNKAASGTAIIEELGEEHIKTGQPIVYTSADSVFQLAAHEEIIPPAELYQMCLKARMLLDGPHRVSRVIARPFVGHPGGFVRTANRRDFSIEPPSDTLLDYAVAKGLEVIAIGKIDDIFQGRGITKAVHTGSNRDGIERTLEFIRGNNKGIIFTNLVDFDMKFGHRNNVEGYATALQQADRGIEVILGSLGEQDIIIITADHGCDPTTESTDHSREYVPILVYGKRIKRGVNLGIRDSFCDIGATVADILCINGLKCGMSFKGLII
jgi:phosphopentomutase